MVRSPVLIVIDDEFAGLYGPERTRIAQAEASLKLFRRIQILRIAAGAAPDVVAFAVEAAVAKPHAVLFSFSNYSGARYYAGQAEGVPIGVLGNTGRQLPAAEGLVLIETDKKADFYRAGRCAAVFSDQNGGGILFFQGDLVTQDSRDAFRRGISAGGIETPPRFINANEDYTPPQGISSVVMAGAAEKYLDKNLSIPIILFSWIDPDKTAREIKLVFDDSPWALAVEAVDVLHRADGPAPIPSKIRVLGSRIGDSRIKEGLKKAIQSKDLY